MGIIMPDRLKPAEMLVTQSATARLGGQTMFV
jgi:hypothetical protein